MDRNLSKAYEIDLGKAAQDIFLFTITQYS